MKTADYNLTDEDIQEAKKIESDPEMMLRLIDLLFLGYEDRKSYPS